LSRWVIVTKVTPVVSDPEKGGFTTSSSCSAPLTSGLHLLFRVIEILELEEVRGFTEARGDTFDTTYVRIVFL